MYIVIYSFIKSSLFLNYDKQMKRIFCAGKMSITSGIILLSFLLFPTKAFAVCPVCTVAVVAGLGLSRWFGIDDAISGIWIGGLILSSGLWMASWLSKHNVRLPFLPLWSAILMYILVIVPLVLTGVIGHPLNRLWGIDKLLIGTTVGSIAFLAGVFTDRVVRVMNNGKVRFFYQKVIFPVSFLITSSLIFYFITRR